MDEKRPGYHVREIPRGKLGEASKIIEELAEFLDAEEQGCKVLAICELADVVGAIGHYLRKRHPSIGLRDLELMAGLTERAFLSGDR